MKRFLSILLILVLTLGVFAACQEPVVETPAATLDDAKTYLAELYKDSNPKPEKDFDLVGKVIVNGVTFTVTWAANLEEIKIKESTKKDFYTVDLPDVNTEAKEYVLTATITDAEGATATVEVKKTLPVVANVSGIVTSPVEGTAYKLFFDQKSLGKVLFLLGEASNDQNKYVKTTIDPKEAPDFYVEVVEGGYKIYTTKNNAKVYLRAATTKSDDGKISKYLGFDDKGTVFAYNADYDAWYSTVDGVNYVMGTYSTYDTASISEDSYYKTEDKRLTQYAVSFITKAEGEEMTPTEGPKDPTELTSLADVLAIGAAKDNNTYTAEKYLVKGTIVEIKSEQYGNMYIQDEAGNKLYVYGTYNSDGSTRFDAMNPQPKVGDVVTLMSIVGKYNDEVQFKNAWVMELQAVACTEHVYDNACDADCNVCKETRTPADHVYDNACDADCNVCAATRTPAAHVYDNECVDADCNVCGATREVAGHKYTDECDAECNVCSEARTAPHKVTAACDTQCDLCGAAVTATAQHTFAADCDNTCDVCGTTRAVTCKDENGDGLCDSCGKVFSQATIDAGKIEVEIGNVVIPSNVHVSGEATLPAVGTQYTDVTITWTATDATVANGKVTFANNGAANVNVTLTATFACGEVTETKTYTVVVSAHVYDNACDANCNVCDAARTPADHVYDNHLDTTCNVCNGGTREATPCVDADKNGKCDDAACGLDVETFPKTNTAYKLYYYQKNLNKILYFKGEMSGFYFATTENVAEAVDIYFEKVDGGYNMYFTKDGAKKYIAVINTGSHINVVFDQAPSVFTYDETLNTMVTVVEDNGSKAGGTMYLGTYGTYNTFSASTVDKAPTSFVGGYAEATDASTCTHEYATPCAPKCHLCGTANANPAHEYVDGACKNCGASDPNAQPPVTDDPNATEVVLDMMGTTNLVSRTTTQTVYAANGITYTNDKASSTTDNYNQTGTYAARAYQGSTVKIEYANMVKIVIVLDDYQDGKYLPGFDGMTVSGATITRAGDTVTIVFESPVNVFQSGELAKQARIETIKVYASAN